MTSACQNSVERRQHASELSFNQREVEIGAFDGVHVEILGCATERHLAHIAALGEFGEQFRLQLGREFSRRLGDALAVAVYTST